MIRYGYKEQLVSLPFSAFMKQSIYEILIKSTVRGPGDVDLYSKLINTFHCPPSANGGLFRKKT